MSTQLIKGRRGHTIEIAPSSSLSSSLDVTTAIVTGRRHELSTEKFEFSPVILVGEEY